MVTVYNEPSSFKSQQSVLSRNSVTPEQQARKLERGRRLRTIRDALGETQPLFAERLTKLARQLGLDHVSYDVGDITTRENGRRDLDAEDYAVVSSIDPVKWTWEWLAFGRKLTRGTRVGGKAVRTGTD
jgi:hypothetical protein